MKSILLSSAAIIGLAGAAAAEVNFGGDATVGYNDDFSNGFFWDATVEVAASQELDNGLTFGAEFDLNIADDDDADTVDFDDYVLSVTSDSASLFFGVTDFAAETLWESAGDMAADNFSEASDEIVIRGDVTFGTVTGSVSYAIEDDAGNEADDDLTQLSIGLVGEFGNVTAGLAYQEESGTFGGGAAAAGNGDYNNNEVIGVFASTTVAGFDVAVAYADNSVTDSLGIEAGYTIGDITLGAYYVSEGGPDDAYGISAAYESGPIILDVYFTDDRNSEEYGLQGSYDVGNGLVVLAGIIDGDSATDNDFANYIGAEYDLGGGAAFNAYYADGNNAAAAASDDIDVLGGRELKAGTTLELTFEF